MSPVECLREFVNERLTAAAEEIFRVFKQTIIEYEEEIGRQRKLLDIVWKPEIKLQRIELPQQHVYQESNSSLDQEEPGPPQIKEEQEELCINQEGGQLVLKLETDASVLTPADEESDPQLLSDDSHVAESQDQKGGEHGDSGSTRDAEPEPTKRHHSSKRRSKKSFSCEICGKCLKHRESLPRHLRVHKGERPYSCKTCGKDFLSGCHLKIHMRIHTGERPYSCKMCGKVFTQSGNLKVHMRSHTGEKPYSCKTCGKDFQCGSGLRVHTRSHTGEKPYTCKKCGKGFAQSSGLKFHTRTHTGEKLYPCTICGRRQSTAFSLARHMKTHTGR